MRATSAEEHEQEAPTAKKAKHEEQIRVRARGGEEVTLLRDAARLMGTLKDLMDLATSEDGIYPMPTIMASTLQMVCKLNDPGYTWPSSDEHSLFQLVRLIEDALYLDAPIALKHIQCAIASQLNGKRAPELCALIGAGGDFGSAEEHLPPNAEPAFVPEDVEAPQQPASSMLPPEPLQQPSFSADAMEAALGLVDVATLAELKGATRSWRALAQRVLCSRLCRRDGQPVPTRLDEITDLDVEQLIEAGRPGDAAVAGLMLPGLARLHGYGYVVDVAAVRAADLQNGAGNTRRDRSLLHGAAKDNLNSCISGEGEPPLELTIAAVACAGSGVVCGLPVQQMREESITTELNLSTWAPLLPCRHGHPCFTWQQQSGCSGCSGNRVAAAMLVAYLFPAMSMLKNCNLLKKSLDIKSATMLAKIGAERGIMLSGMTRGQRQADFSNQNLQPADAILIASDLIFIAVVTTLYLGNNSIGDEGAIAIAEAMKVNAVLTELSLWYNNIGDEGAIAIAEALKVNSVLTTLRLDANKIGPEGAMVIAEALKVNVVVTELRLDHNDIGDEGAKAIAYALKVNTVLAELELGYNSIGNHGAEAIAEALKVNAVLTNLCLLHNNIGDDGAKAIAEALKVNVVLTELFLWGNDIGDDGAKVIAEALKVNAVVTTLHLNSNNIGNEGAKVISEALKVNAVLTKLELDYNSIGDDGAKAIAEALKVNAVLTSLHLYGNKIGAAGAIAIAEALMVNAVLTKLYLLYNSMGDAGGKAVRDAVKGRSGFVLEL
jgi:Ran GTPase-activating protein (RanGAP) involved in mRNA processing and transport